LGYDFVATAIHRAEAEKVQENDYNERAGVSDRGPKPFEHRAIVWLGERLFRPRFG
jgi:hypothetical protein